MGMFKTPFLFFYLSIFFMCPSALSAAASCKEVQQSPKVVLVIPAPKDSVFWSNIDKIANAASKQLNINLKTYYYETIEGQRYSYSQYIDEVLSKELNAQYLISKFINKIEKKVIDVANKYGVKLLTFNSDLTEAVQTKIGLPQSKHKHWLYHVESNELLTGYDLADFVIREKQKTKQQVNLLAFNGNIANEVAILRAEGLISRVEEDENIKLLQLISTNWTYSQVRLKASILLKRFKDIDVIWCASDEIARAVVDEVKQSRPELLENLVVGGIDWSPEVMPYLSKRSISVSYGGHLFDIAFVLSLLYDYHNHSSKNNNLATLFQNKNAPLSGSVNKILLKQEYDELNFRALSQCHSEHLSAYNYNVTELLNSASINN